MKHQVNSLIKRRFEGERENSCQVICKRLRNLLRIIENDLFFFLHHRKYSSMTGLTQPWISIRFFYPLYVNSFTSLKVPHPISFIIWWKYSRVVVFKENLVNVLAAYDFVFIEKINKLRMIHSQIRVVLNLERLGMFGTTPLIWLFQFIVINEIKNNKLIPEDIWWNSFFFLSIQYT